MLRRVAHRLHPAIIDQAGLIPALNQLSSDVERSSGIEIETQFEDNGEAARLSRERALMLYRIAQEALRNVVKHSGAKRARVKTRTSHGAIEITVQDFGRGFESTDPAKSAGLGLISMAERTRLAEGEFDIRSTPGEGTIVPARPRVARSMGGSRGGERPPPPHPRARVPQWWGVCQAISWRERGSGRKHPPGPR